MSKVVTVHGHTLELDMGPSCPNPGIRRQLDAKGEPYMCTSDLTTWIGEFDLRATYGVGFVESLPDIANGEMIEIQEFNGMKFSNVSLVNEDYVVSYKPLYLNV